MIKKGRKLSSKKYYVPSPVIENFIKEKLRSLKTDKSSTNLNRRKVTVLDKIFQSMADLIYFLEAVAAHPKLEEAFRKDLIELFDTGNKHIIKELHPDFGVKLDGVTQPDNAFARLIFASLAPHEDVLINYRLRLLSTIQSIVYTKTRSAFRYTFGVNEQVTKSALNDLKNAVGWTLMMGREDPFEKYDPYRSLGFSHPYPKRK